MISKILKKLMHYTFGKISNGILFVVLGFTFSIIGLISSLWIFFLLSGVFEVLGIILSFIRESMYQDAVKEISSLRATYRALRNSTNMLHGKVDLLDQDLNSAQERISRLESFKFVDLRDGRKGLTGKEGPAFEKKNAANDS